MNNRIKLRIEYARETNKLFSDNIPLYADWLEKKLAKQSKPICKCGSNEYYAESYKDKTEYYCKNCKTELK
jgi:hypothetical protein